MCARHGTNETLTHGLWLGLHFPAICRARTPPPPSPCSSRRSRTAGALPCPYTYTPLHENARDGRAPSPPVRECMQGHTSLPPSCRGTQRLRSSHGETVAETAHQPPSTNKHTHQQPRDGRRHGLRGREAHPRLCPPPQGGLPRRAHLSQKGTDPLKEARKAPRTQPLPSCVLPWINKPTRRMVADSLPLQCKPGGFSPLFIRSWGLEDYTHIF